MSGTVDVGKGCPTLCLQGRRDLNPQPLVLETSALPIELRPSATCNENQDEPRTLVEPVHATSAISDPVLVSRVNRWQPVLPLHRSSQARRRVVMPTALRTTRAAASPTRPASRCCGCLRSRNRRRFELGSGGATLAEVSPRSARPIVRCWLNSARQFRHDRRWRRNVRSVTVWRSAAATNLGWNWRHFFDLPRPRRIQAVSLADAVAALGLRPALDSFGPAVSSISVGSETAPNSCSRSFCRARCRRTFAADSVIPSWRAITSWD